MPAPPDSSSALRRVVEVFAAFLRLGLTSFGGPVAHLGFFRAEFVGRRRWLDDAAYADLVALCQFLPGPASSQVGFGLGYFRAGLGGALAAWIGFTLPSAALMIAAAYGAAAVTPGAGWLQGLEVAAAAVVAQAVGQMARRLCPDAPRALVAFAVAGLALAGSAPWLPVALIAGAAAAGSLIAPPAPAPLDHAHPGRVPGRWLAAACLAVFGALVIGLPLGALSGFPPLERAAAFARAGAWVFGGGHVVLPLLEGDLVGRGGVTPEAFLAGYGLAQALPGPLFAFAGYLGTLAGGGWAAGIGALSAMFAPSFLLLLGVLPHWHALRAHARSRRALAGANAGVVGLLAAALVHPIGTAALTSAPALGLGLAALAALQLGRLPPWLVVGLCALAGSRLL